MSLTIAERTSLIELVVGMFNAAPGAAYLADLSVGYEANGRSLLNLAVGLGSSGAFKLVTPVTFSAAEFAFCFLSNLGLQNNAYATTYIIGQDTAHVPRGQIIYTALAALEATTDSQFQSAKVMLHRKIEVAEYYSVTKGIVQTDIFKLQAVVAGVDETAASVTRAKDLIDHPVVANALVFHAENISMDELHATSATSSDDTWHHGPSTLADGLSMVTDTIEVMGIHPLG